MNDLFYERDCLIWKLEKDKKDLEERVEKAISYLEAGKTFPSDETKETVEYMQNILLDILKGSDTNDNIYNK